jgi:hypothetical protein
MPCSARTIAGNTRRRISSTNSVAAMAKTPSLNASIREELSDLGISA